jgi:hypothetical protein
VSSKDIPHTCRGDGDAELGALADDAEVTPSRILPSETNDEGNDFFIERVGRVASARECPVASDERRAFDAIAAALPA